MAQGYRPFSSRTIGTVGSRGHSPLRKSGPLWRICRLVSFHLDSQYRNDLWSFDTVSMRWSEVATTGKVPAIRSNATLHFHAEGNQLILFGGGGPNKSRYNDVCLLDWETKHWTRVFSPEGENSPW